MGEQKEQMDQLKLGTWNRDPETKN